MRIVLTYILYRSAFLSPTGSRTLGYRYYELIEFDVIKSEFDNIFVLFLLSIFLFLSLLRWSTRVNNFEYIFFVSGCCYFCGLICMPHPSMAVRSFGFCFIFILLKKKVANPFILNVDYNVIIIISYFFLLISYFLTCAT